ncbi:MAG: molybdopterin-dependent oxidoreductase [Anaerolineales bacterium]
MATYRLAVTGRVDHPLTLTYDELRCLPKVGVHCALVCLGTFVDYATWAGTPFESVLARAGVQSGAQSIVLVGADGYSTLVDLDLVKSSHAFLAYELNGGILPVLHGFPVRAVFPGVEGNNWAKWVVRIEVH